MNENCEDFINGKCKWLEDCSATEREDCYSPPYEPDAETTEADKRKGLI